MTKNLSQSLKWKIKKGALRSSTKRQAKMELYHSLLAEIRSIKLYKMVKRLLKKRKMRNREIQKLEAI